MPTELVVLTTTPLPTETIAVSCHALVPGCAVLDVDGTGVRLVLDPSNRPIATIYASRAIVARQDADAALGGSSRGWEYWTDVTIPYGDATPGRLLAQHVAQSGGGVVKERI